MIKTTLNRQTIIPGLRKLLHGGDYNPDQWLNQPEVIDKDFELMHKAGCNTFSLGIFSWTQYEPKEGEYCFDWLDSIMNRMADEGHKVMLATPSGAKPAWMAKKYPEIRRVTEAGNREPYRSRHNHCWQSPVYREKVLAINTLLAKRYGQHPALGAWHVSNELEGACYCSYCLENWQNWLKERYQTLDKLNAAWWTGFWNHIYTDWDEIDPRDRAMDGLALDWRRFNTWQLCDFLLWESKPLRTHSPHIPITTNFMNLYPHTDYAEVSKHVDFVSDDQYPGFDTEDDDLLERVIQTSFKSDLFRSFKGKEVPWMLMESAPDWVQWEKYYRFKRPGIHRAEMLQALGHGAEGTCYFQWRKGRGGFEKFHSAVVDHVGHEHTRVFRNVAEVGKLFSKLDKIIGSKNDSDCAVIFDWQVLWAMEASCGMPKDERYYLKTCLAHYRPLWEQGQSIDVIGSLADFSPYKILIAPQLFMLLPGVANRLRKFVNDGGNLVMTYNSGLCNESNLCFTQGWPGDGLMDLFGVWNEEGESLKPGKKRKISVLSADFGGQQASLFEATRYCAIIDAKKATVLAAYHDDFYQGSPCLTHNCFGKGNAYYLAADFSADLLRSFYRMLVKKSGLPHPLGNSLPGGVALQTRVSDEGTYYFLQNFTEQEVSIPLENLRLRCLETGKVCNEEWIIPAWHSVVCEKTI